MGILVVGEWTEGDVTNWLQHINLNMYQFLTYIAIGEFVKFGNLLEVSFSEYS